MPLLGTKKSRIVMTCLAGLPVTLRSNQLINGLRQEHILLTITEVTLQGLELRLTGRRLDRLAQTTDTGQARTSSVLTASSEFSVCAVLRCGYDYCQLSEADRSRQQISIHPCWKVEPFGLDGPAFEKERERVLQSILWEERY
ncbi:hypothetical protein X801_03242 [Opisthorchis viverrini]|uniref:Uncharacterized protein n=1 Tax=Opisthorchis viverrini TaxID=6198 RepID=A0A1S8X2C9_OPIVI|nr:hypothetical protein X801_03242 [Opisthorchis viverrini]